MLKIRKIVALVLALVLVTGLVACSGRKASDKAISVGKEALEVVDGYLDRKISSADAREKLDSLKTDMEYVNDLSSDDKNKIPDFFVQSDLLILSSSILTDGLSGTDETYAKVLKARNELAKNIGEKAR